MIRKKFRFKYWIGQVHLCMGLISGLFVCFLGITGCILAFEREIENFTQPYRFVKPENRVYLEPSVLKNIADKQVPGKHAHSVGYEKGKAATVVYYAAEPEYYWIVFLNPYTGSVLKVKDMSTDFFRIMIKGHYYLWLPPEIGQPVLATATLLFFFLLLSGLILWWPRNAATSRKRFTVKWNASWKRVNYDLHSVLGFYVTWILIFIAFSGLVMGFQWFAKSTYWITSGGKALNYFEERFSDTTQVPVVPKPAIDILWARTLKAHPDYQGSIEVHVPDSPKATIEVALNPETGTYWKTSYLYYDQYSLKEINVDQVYGKFKKTRFADKLLRANYDIHVGAIGGLPGKILAFCASFVAASLPVTGFLIWRGRKKNQRKH
ncbi:PepSY-associated TM helix domain-containing protein [Pedobacter sp. JY14-1]|uniref:PepSY-associated TM helix domain-containing protein n=1 Tax=Pedobacter sp. JY14-1 TaxID=3034151 RepID=UPI0023E23ED4|nr:PepSY-associated TM helix domain-containing protein [Pedobacter sp. JY14-1]